MKSILILLPTLLVAWFMTGCQSPYHAERLIELPDYQLTQAYDKSATIVVQPEVFFASEVEEALRNEGYTVRPYDDYHQATLTLPDKIIVPVSNRYWYFEYNGDLYLYARVLCAIRQPLIFSADGTRTSTYSPRLFQAHARLNLGDVDEATTEDFVRARKMAISNFLRIPAFCEALQPSPAP